VGEAGVCTGIPQSRFAFNRSYIDRFLITQAFMPTDQVGRHFVLRPTPYGGLTWYITVKEKFWTWSSNNFTLDYIIEDNYIIVDGDPTHYPLPYKLRYIPPAPSAGAAIAFEYLEHGAPYSDGGLSPRNLPYWLPDSD